MRPSPPALEREAAFCLLAKATTETADENRGYLFSLRNLIAVVRASWRKFHAVNRGGARERLSDNDQRTQTLPQVRLGNPGRCAGRRLPRLPSREWPSLTRRRSCSRGRCPQPPDQAVRMVKRSERFGSSSESSVTTNCWRKSVAAARELFIARGRKVSIAQLH